MAGVLPVGGSVALSADIADSRLSFGQPSAAQRWRFGVEDAPSGAATG